MGKPKLPASFALSTDEPIVTIHVLDEGKDVKTRDKIIFFQILFS